MKGKLILLFVVLVYTATGQNFNDTIFLVNGDTTNCKIINIDNKKISIDVLYNGNKVSSKTVYLYAIEKYYNSTTNEYYFIDVNTLKGNYKHQVSAKKPTPYYNLREADVMWSKCVWRILDLREKINHPLYYPSIPYNNQPLDGRYSLIALLVKGVEKEGLVVYDASMDDEFRVPLSFEDLVLNLGGGNDTILVEDIETFELIPSAVSKEMRLEEVTRIMLKEEIYFDKQRSKIEVRIIGICPIRTYYKDDDIDNENLTLKQVMWVYYPSVRNMLANHEVFNPFNDAERRTFDEIFMKRRFSSYIYRVTNVYNNRRIEEYKIGLDALLESEKIKESFLKFENDLWEN